MELYVAHLPASAERIGEHKPKITFVHLLSSAAEMDGQRRT